MKNKQLMTNALTGGLVILYSDRCQYSATYWNCIYVSAGVREEYSYSDLSHFAWMRDYRAIASLFSAEIHQLAYNPPSINIDFSIFSAAILYTAGAKIGGDWADYAIAPSLFSHPNRFFSQGFLDGYAEKKGVNNL